MPTDVPPEVKTVACAGRIVRKLSQKPIKETIGRVQRGQKSMSFKRSFGYKPRTMDSSTTFPAFESQENVRPTSSANVTPWFCQAIVFAATCILVGIVWDISWHSTV